VAGIIAPMDVEYGNVVVVGLSTKVLGKSLADVWYYDAAVAAGHAVYATPGCGLEGALAQTPLLGFVMFCCGLVDPK